MCEKGGANCEDTQGSGRGMETPKEGISSHLLVQVKMSLELANPEVPSHTEPGVWAQQTLCRSISITGVQLHPSPTPNTPKDTTGSLDKWKIPSSWSWLCSPSP